MTIFAHVVGADAALNGGWITTQHAVGIAVAHMSAKISIMTLWVVLAPSHPYDALLMDHKVLVAVVIEALGMLALALGPDLCSASYTVCSCHTEGSIDDEVLILKGDVVHVSEAPETSFHF
eukprot:1044611-Amphidinium_carterae.1